jgi:hypothetical protein
MQIVAVLHGKEIYGAFWSSANDPNIMNSRLRQRTRKAHQRGLATIPIGYVLWH